MFGLGLAIVYRRKLFLGLTNYGLVNITALVVQVKLRLRNVELFVELHLRAIRVSLAISEHTTRHNWTHFTLSPGILASTRITYPVGWKQS